MSSNTSTQINSSDPSVARQVQRENSTVQRQATLASAPSVNGSVGTTTTSASQAVRSIAPIVSGSEVVYPQSTTTTSSNAVTINSSVNNDVGDVTTVYSTNGQITVNPINQTINQYTSTESGVSQIVAGSGVTITSTGASGTGVVTINATGGGVGNIAVLNLNGNSQTWLAGNGVFANIAIPTVGNIATLNLDGNASNVLRGDGTWGADANSSYGNSNVVSLMAAFGSNTITTTGNINVGNIVGNGQALTGLAGANVSGFVPNANVANTAFAVAAANVSGLGNIATINLTSSSSNVLYGNGVFAAIATSAGIANGTSNVSIATANGNVTIAAVGNTTMVVTGTGANISGTLNVTGNITGGNIDIPNGYANVTGTANTVGGGATVGVRSILAIDSAFGSNDANDPASAQAVRGRVTGSNLTKTRNYVAGVTGQYLVTGTNASEFINTGLLGVVGDQTTTANAAVVAYLDGDGGLTTAGSAYGVSMKNSTPGSGFDYGLDLQFINLNVAGTTTLFKQADIRFNNGVTLVANTAGNISIDANVTVGNIIATNIGNIIAANLVAWTTAPIANTSAGTAGQAAYDSGGNLYVCVATNTWSKFSGTTSW